VLLERHQLRKPFQVVIHTKQSCLVDTVITVGKAGGDNPVLLAPIHLISVEGVHIRSAPVATLPTLAAIVGSGPSG